MSESNRSRIHALIETAKSSNKRMPPRWKSESQVAAPKMGREKQSRRASTGATDSVYKHKTQTSRSGKKQLDFVAEAMKEMDPARMIELLEIYAQTDSELGWQCLQGLQKKNATGF